MIARLLPLAPLALLAPIVLLAACVAPQKPARGPVPPPAGPAVALPPPVVDARDWRDAALSPGTWSYERGKDGSIARYGAGVSGSLLVVQCAANTREVSFRRPGAAPAAEAAVTTSYGVRRFPAGAIMDGQGWRMNPRDPALDQIAFSRGRILIEGLGPRLIVPAWAELARVIEDCRG